MFSDKQINDFRCIKAPDELRQRVLSDTDALNTRSSSAGKIRHRVFAFSTAVAAVLVLAVGLPLGKAFSDARPVVSFNHTTLTSSPVPAVDSSVPAVASARNIGTLTVPVELELKRETSISVSDGSFTWINSEMSAELPAVTSLRLDGSVALEWSVPCDNTDEIYVMSLENKLSKCDITLAYDNSADLWKISCEY